MIPWPAKRIVTRIAENNARKIQAALKVSVNPRKVAREYLASNPQETTNPTADRVTARMWAYLNVSQDVAPLRRMIRQSIMEGWVTGEKAANHMIKRSVRVVKEVSIAEIALDPNADVWKDWDPGDEVSAEILERKYGLDLLLQEAEITIRGVEKTTVDLIGTRLADGLRKGKSVDQIAEDISDYVADPARALTIAMTETTRATSMAAKDRYREAKISKMQWYGMDPCPICAENDGEVVEIGMPFASGHTEPPAHPNCLCGLLPVITEQDYQDITEEADAVASEAFRDAREREKRLTEDLIDIQRALGEAGVPEPEFSGLRFRLKQKKSLRRKIVDEVSKGEYGSLEEAARGLSDAVRYTYVWDGDDYVTGIQATLNVLAERGYGLRVKNYWLREDYKGINVAVTEPSGKIFELQFHTVMSKTMKDDLHILYEKYRVSKDDAERWRLWSEMKEIAAKIPDPKNREALLNIGTIKMEYFTDARGNVRRGNPGAVVRKGADRGSVLLQG